MATGSSLFTAERIFPVFLLNVFAKNEKTDLSQTERRPKPLCSVYRRQRSHDPGMGARTRRAFGSREGLPHGDWPRAGCRAPSAGAFCVQRQSWHRASVRTSVRGVRRTVRDRARVNDSSRLDCHGPQALPDRPEKQGLRQPDLLQNENDVRDKAGNRIVSLRSVYRQQRRMRCEIALS